MKEKISFTTSKPKDNKYLIKWDQEKCDVG